MIDTKELRRLLEEDGKNNIDLGEIHELLDRLEAAEKDVALKERVIDALGSELNAVANERGALRAKLGAVEKELEVERMRLAACGVAALGYFNGCAKEYESSSLYDVMELRAKNEELRAKIEQMKQQGLGFRERCAPSSPTGYSNRFPLYALPGAKGE